MKAKIQRQSEHAVDIIHTILWHGGWLALPVSVIQSKSTLPLQSYTASNSNTHIQDKLYILFRFVRTLTNSMSMVHPQTWDEFAQIMAV